MIEGELVPWVYIAVHKDHALAGVAQTAIEIVRLLDGGACRTRPAVFQPVFLVCLSRACLGNMIGFDKETAPSQESACAPTDAASTP
eukprot:COSAG06_NODE_19433_length_839_cov_0.854054_1_plen_87_part_00